MKNFAALIHRLEISNKTNDKTDALAAYFASAAPADKLWVIALFTGRRPRRPVNAALLRTWALEITGLPEWLFLESYSSVGDLGETISLILPKPQHTIEKPLAEWMGELIALQKADDAYKKEYVLNAWNGLGYRERFIFNKLIGGSFRIGVSNKLLVNALAKYSGKEPSAIMHSIMGKWDPADADFDAIISGMYITEDNSRPYPFCLAYPIEKEVAELGDAANWQAEWKWDGIRGQIIKRNGEFFIWSRGEELVTAQFPELQSVAAHLPDGIVIDGEILVVKNGEVQSFNTLQKRLNRKTFSKKMLEENPVGF